MSELLAEMIANYKDSAGRVDEVLYREVMNVVHRLEEEKRRNQVIVLKERKGIPTVIEWNGDRYTFDAGTTFRGGVRRGKPQKKGQAYKAGEGSRPVPSRNNT
ncbi:hypothetical protein ACFQ38_00255 [Sporosarcina contaminans]|uniref:Uncharacterized protein n=1 Tax=Sporosarcina contaminans TaxID=633403 RepID=A0ABW3TVS4_9BACL